MDHTPAKSIDWRASPAEHFTGAVWFGPLSHATEGGLNALGVQFSPGARTDWHSHPEGQVLYVVAGAGLVQTEGGETVEISAGDVVYASPGELHWHGAKPDSPMMHLSLTTGGATEWEPRKVTDEEYRRR
jgi:quercetin dioxygenase-like cupin family protein